MLVLGGADSGPTLAGEVLWKTKVDAMFARLWGYGEFVKAGEIYGELVEPDTGHRLGTIGITKDAIVIPSGREPPCIGAT